MAKVLPGRYTAQVEGDFVVFLIGMRLNKPWKVRRWWPVAAAMPKMLRALDEHPELGCLGYQSWMGRTTLLVQYWRDFDSLDRFRGTRTCHISNRGDASTAQSETRATWASGTRPIASTPASTRRSTATCPCSAWRPPRGTCRWPERPRRQRLGSEPARPTSRPSSPTEDLCVFLPGCRLLVRSA